MISLRSSASLRPLRTGHKPLFKNLAVPRRNAHVPVKLPYDETEGLGKFMSPKTLQMVAGDYQAGLLNNLNDLVRGTPQEKQDVYSSVVAFAPDPSKTLEFNYASQALNNSFFLSTLRPPPAEPKRDTFGHEFELEQNSELSNSIANSFGSLSQLKSTFSAAGRGMFGSGWVWLVASPKKELAVVATYGAGTVLVRSREQVGPKVTVLGQSPEQATNSFTRPRTGYLSPTLSRYSPLSSSPLSGAPTASSYEHHDPTTRSSSTMKAATEHLARSTQPIHGGSQWDQQYIPLLVCSIHEHCWLLDHGIMGKEAYLENFWEVVNWQSVATLFSKAVAR